MESPIRWIPVFAGAVIAHRERVHHRLATVVRKILDDGESRTAIRAVYERVAKSAVFGIEQLPGAVIADTQVGGNQGALLALPLLGETDLEILVALQGDLL